MDLTTQLAADVLGLKRKQLDNLLVRFGPSLGLSGTQGRSRAISRSNVELLAVALLLNRDTGASLDRSLGLARRLLDAGDGSIELGALASLRFDVTRLRFLLQQALADALEGQATPKRGRPRQKT